MFEINAKHSLSPYTLDAMGGDSDGSVLIMVPRLRSWYPLVLVFGCASG